MKFYLNVNVGIYDSIVEEIANGILNRLNNKLIFSKKLDVLEILINDETKNDTSGVMNCSEDPNIFRIILNINSKDSIWYIKFVIAHELFHLLFAPINTLYCTGYSSTDDSYHCTSLTRYDAKKGYEYGTQLEEMVCNILAIQTVEIIYGKAKIEDNDIYQQFIKSNSEKFKLTKEIIDLFECGKCKDYKLDDVCRKKEKSTVPCNIFTYSIVSFCSENIVRQYDSVMGNGSWKNLLKTIDKIFQDRAIVDEITFLNNELFRFNILFKKIKGER